jgi:hypothetical protein
MASPSRSYLPFLSVLVAKTRNISSSCSTASVCMTVCQCMVTSAILTSVFYFDLLRK